VSEAERREYLQIIIYECDRQIDLVLNLFDLSRIEAGSFEVTSEEVDAAEVVRSCVLDEGATARERCQDLQVELPDEPPTVKADYGALRRVVCILIDNAVKYTPRGGQISVTAEQLDLKLAIRVSDKGIGITTDDLPHIFEKFYRGRFTEKQNDDRMPEEYYDDGAVPGAGLGLYLARQITEQMGGQVSVESQVGVGSVFTVCLPVWRDDNEMENVNEEE
jgi:signal transduction histidine kinase